MGRVTKLHWFIEKSCQERSFYSKVICYSKLFYPSSRADGLLYILTEEVCSTPAFLCITYKIQVLWEICLYSCIQSPERQSITFIVDVLRTSIYLR
jgi:hypothetical protein